MWWVKRSPVKVSALLVAAGLVGAGPLAAQTAVPPEALARWREARFGMFIHWGPVSLTGREIGWSRGAPTPVEEYDNLHRRFNPEKFDAGAWVEVAKAAGMRYIVLTTKHHDGFCLWDSKVTDHDIAATPFRRDVVKELAEACRKGGLGFGAYYSTCDWHHPDFPRTGPGGRVKREKADLDRYTAYLKAQTTELLRDYGPLFTLWYDVPQEFDATRGQSVIDLARSIQPDIVINNRTGAPGDYDTPEQRIGGFQMDRPWETCMTIGTQWSWKPEEKLKPLDECLHTLLRTIGADGNLLFNVGPRPDGVIDPPQVERLRGMGEWVGRHAGAIHGTRGGPYLPTSGLASTRGGNRVYLHVLKWPAGPLRVPVLTTPIKSAALMDGTRVGIANGGKHLTLGVPAEKRDPVATVIVFELAGDALAEPPISCFRGLNDEGAKLKASAVFGESPAHAAAMAGDGDPATRWAAPAGASEAWLEMDLGSERRIRGLEIEEATAVDQGMPARVRGFVIEARAGDAWETRFEGREVGEFLRCDFAPIQARYLRLRITDATEGPTLREVRIIE